MNILRIKKTLDAIEELKDYAIKIACIKTDYLESDVDYITFDKNEEEGPVCVNFRWPSGCSCCSDDADWIYVSMEDLGKDIEKIIEEVESQRVEKERKKELEKKQKEQEELEKKEKRDRDNYERLKKKYEKQ